MSRASRCALVALVLVLMAAPLATLHPAVTHAYAAGLSNLSIEITHPRVFGFVLLASITALPTAGFLVSLLGTVKGSGSLRTLVCNSTSSEWDGLQYRVFPDDAVVVFTAGFWRPATFVSTRAEQSLEPAEFRAALLHEQAHQRNNDILWRLLLRAVGNAFPFLPWLRRVIDTEVLRTECEADDYALRGGARRRDLFEAIAAASSPPATAVGLTDASVELRLVRLVHPETPLPGGPTGSFLALAGVVALPAVVAHIIVLAAAACTVGIGI